MILRNVITSTELVDVDRSFVELISSLNGVVKISVKLK